MSWLAIAAVSAGLGFALGRRQRVRGSELDLGPALRRKRK